jgi:hypothetical protein
MRDKIYNALRDMDISETINNAPKDEKLGIELSMGRYGNYKMRYPDKPCKTCIVQASCQSKIIYDLGDLNIVKAANPVKCEKIELWTEIVKGEELKEKFYDESRKRSFKGEINDDKNHEVYLAMSIDNLKKLSEYRKLLDS